MLGKEKDFIVDVVPNILGGFLKTGFLQLEKKLMLISILINHTTKQIPTFGKKMRIEKCSASYSLKFRHDGTIEDMIRYIAREVWQDLKNK